MEKYFKELLSRLVPLQIENGGPIIMFQVIVNRSVTKKIECFIFLSFLVLPKVEKNQFYVFKIIINYIC